MDNLLAEVVPLALVSAISPLVLMGALVLLGGRDPLRRCGFFLVGIFVMTAIFYVVAYVAMHLDVRGSTGEHGYLSSLADQIAIAILLLGCGTWFIVRAPNPAMQEKLLQRLDSPRIPTLAYFVVGLVMMWFSASFVVIISIVHRMSVAGLPLRQNIVVLLIAVVITSLPALVPFVSELVGGDATRERLLRLGRWTTINGRYILGALLIVLGLQNLLKAFGS